MKEPNLEAVLECLSDLGYEYEDADEESDVLDAIFEKRKNIDVDLQQILYFCRKERAATFENAISQLRDERYKQRVISSVISMYPITKNVIIKMLKKADITPADYLEIVDFDSTLLKNIKDSLSKITQNSSANNYSANKYFSELEKIEKDIASLNMQRDEMTKNIKDYSKKIAEKAKLEKEISEIENLQKSGGIEFEIDELKIKKNNLEKQKKIKEKEKRCLEQEINVLVDYLKSNEDKCENKEYSAALRALQNCIKAMPNGR